MEVSRNHSRAFTLSIEGKIAETPSFVPAISGCCSVVPIKSCLRILTALNHPRFLVSAYDIENAPDELTNKNLAKQVSSRSQGQTITFLDSGSYEAQCLRDVSWKVGKLERVLRAINIDVCFSFDVYPERGVSSGTHFKRTISAIARTAGSQRRGLTVPVLHSSPSGFPSFTRKVLEAMNPQMLGIPEKELGLGILERARALLAIRRSLDQTGRDVPIHLLGTSNPISILTYTLFGADLFDGLDWSRSVVDPKSGHVRNFSHLDLLDCDCMACRNTQLTYVDRLMAHNLMFYEVFMAKARAAITEDRGLELLKEYIGEPNARKIEELLSPK